MEFTEITAVPAIVGLVQLAKEVGFPNRFLPLLDLVLGIAGSFLLYGANWQVALSKGVIIGLSAAGLYRSSRVLLKGE